MKKLLALILALIMVMSLTSALAFADGPEVTIRFATNKADNDPACQGFEDFKSYVEETSGGSIKVDIYYNSTLYTDTDMLMAMSQGNCDMGIAGADKAGVYIPAMNCLYMGYLFTSPEHLFAMYKSDIGQNFSKQLVDEIGVRWAGLYYNGARTINLAIDKEIVTPEDMKGIQMRMPNSPAFVNLGKAMGCSPVAMDLSEVYNALQAGTVDGQDNPLPTILANKYYEVTKSITLSKHVISENSVFMSDAFYQNLTAEQQKIIDDGIQVLCDSSTKAILEQENTCADELRSYGITIYEPDITAMREAVIAWYYDNPESTKGWDLDILDQIINLEF